MIIFFLQSLISKLHCNQLPHVDHKCSGGVSTEKAGMGSGTVTFDGTICALTITDIPNLWDYVPNAPNYNTRLNIIGLKWKRRCSSSSIRIYSVTYCVDMSVKDTVINVRDQEMTFEIEFTQARPFTLRYYRGEPLKLMFASNFITDDGLIPPTSLLTTLL